jgi:hypothetical protein
MSMSDMVAPEAVARRTSYGVLSCSSGSSHNCGHIPQCPGQFGPVEVRFDLVSRLKLPKVAGSPTIMVLGEDFLTEVSTFRDIPAVLVED